VVDYPARGGPLPIELANTLFARDGQPCDGLTTPAELARWLAANALPDALPEQMESFRALRHAIRALLQAAVDDVAPAAAALELVNELSAAAPRFARLVWADRTPRAVLVDAARPDQAALGQIARATIDLLGGADRVRVRRCGAPGCVLFFLQQRRRTDWCSAACGNRARVARHYRRHRRPGGERIDQA
jgi:predicted RNA-binding Zn ribbon-like protein